MFMTTWDAVAIKLNVHYHLGDSLDITNTVRLVQFALNRYYRARVG